MINYTIDKLKSLTAIDSPSGFTKNVISYSQSVFESLGFATQITKKGCLLVELGGEGEPLAISAHVDTLGGMVCQIKSNGALKISKIGGLNANNIETENCKIYTRDGKCYDGVFQLADASLHVNKNYDDTKRDFNSCEVLIDEPVYDVDGVKSLGIDVGDFVCFDPRTTVTASGFIKSRFLDDKLSVAMLMGVAKKIADEKLTLNRKVYLYITAFEEVGHGCSHIPCEIDEMLCVDMGCMGDGLQCDYHSVSICVKDGRSPYTYDVVTALVDIAKKNNIKYALDVYPFYGSDADACLDSGHDIKHGLVGTGVYASHGYERSHVDGVKNTMNLILKYITKGE